MLQAKRRGFFKQRFEITSGEQSVTEFSDFRKEGCEFFIEGQRHRVSRERRKRFVLHGPRGWLATADLDSGKHCTISSTTGRFELVKPSMWRSAWELLDQGGRPLGRIHQKGSTSTAELPQEIDLPTRLFAYYVVLMLWRRAAAAAAAANSGGGGGG